MQPKKLLIPVILVFLLAESTLGYRLFWYSDEIDRRDNLAYAAQDRFDGWDDEDFNDFGDYNCISLDDYNEWADRDAYDGFEPLSAANIRKKDFNRLRWQDQQAIINENPYDGWDEKDIDDYEDMHCWTLKDYNSFAAKKPHDRWDIVRFRDFDDFKTVQKVGTERYHFFEPDDFSEFTSAHKATQAIHIFQRLS